MAITNPPAKAQSLSDARRENYNKVAGCAELLQIMLIASEFKMSPAFFAARSEEKDSKKKLSYYNEYSVEGLDFDSDEGVASMTIRFSVRATKDRKNLLSIKNTYIVVYGEMEGCEDGAVSAFMQRIGRFAAYPYFRTHVSQLSWESGANLPILPTVRT